MAKRKKRKRKKKKKKFNSNFGSAVSRNAERRRQAKSSYGYLKLPSGMPIFSPEPKSKTKLDIMPYIVTDESHPDRYDDENIAMPGNLWYRRPFSIHRNIGAERDTVVCPRSTGTSACPICEYRERRMREGAAYDDEDIKSIKPSDRNLYVVIPINSREYDEIPHIWDMSHYLFQDLLDEELEERPEMGIFPDLEEGKMLRVRWDEGQAFGNSFAEASRIDFYDREEPYDESILDDIPNLDKILQVLSHDELEAKFLEIDKDDIADEDTEEDWEDEPADRTRTEDLDEEDWDEEEDWEEEEDFEEDWDEEEDWEEDEKWEDDEDWDDEDWDDEDWDEEEDWEEEEPEPEKPKRTRKSKSKKKKSKKKKKRKRKKRS